MEREVGGGIGMGNTCKPMAVSFQCMTKSTTIKKIIKMAQIIYIYIYIVVSVLCQIMACSGLYFFSKSTVAPQMNSLSLTAGS